MTDLTDAEQNPEEAPTSSDGPSTTLTSVISYCAVSLWDAGKNFLEWLDKEPEPDPPSTTPHPLRGITPILFEAILHHLNSER